ncbi:aminopeptidase N [Embleya sp. NPDC050493]|uniref:aminopeptidase N n=1 Tax=Embleya sp. NPDC050493 TaxID=3363989 RepID=UPI00379D7C3D
MPGRNLTREEARTRARILSVEDYDVRLDVTTDSTETFRSETVLRFGCREAGAATFVDLLAPDVHEVVLNGRTLDPAQVFDGTRVLLDDLVEGANELRVLASCAYSRTGEGLHRFVDPVDDRVYLYTQYEPADSRRVFANFEQPDLKASFRFSVTAPADWHVVSNSTTPDPVTVREGVARWDFAPTPRISTYLTAVVAGPYHAVFDTYTGPDGLVVPLGGFCRASLADAFDHEEIFAVTRQGLDLFHDRFDFPYPFGKYDQLFVPEYNLGAMENPGAVTFTEDFVFRSKVTDSAYENRANVILHEMAHMWFGDLVTPRWWDDLWLKESFADFMGSYSQGAATRWTDAWTSFAARRKDWAYRQDQLPTTHPIVAVINDLEDAKLNFDGITYAKGASVLKQLVAYVGEDEFFAGARSYFKKHAWGNTTLADFLSALEETSGRDLKSWSADWLETSGVNTLRPAIETDADGVITSFAVLQEAAPAFPTLRPHRIAIGLYDGAERVARVEVDVVGARTEVPELVGRVRTPLILLNDDDLTYAKVRFDPRSWQAVLDSLGELDSSLARALCWGAAWDMTRDGELPARDYLALVLRHAGRESDVGVVQKLQVQVRTGLDRYTDPAFRAEGLRLLAAGSLAELRAATPGGDHQLAWARCLASASATAEELAFLRDLLTGDQEVAGLTVDTELRWAMLRALCTGGAADEPDIAAELERDGTAAGRRHAIECRAARPTPEAKAEAWRLVVETDELPNAMLNAVIAGFSTPGQEDLTDPYTDRYFAALAPVWRDRSIEIARRIVVGLYPSGRIDVDTLRRTDDWLAATEPVPALRRLVLECRDDVARALQARARDQRN